MSSERRSALVEAIGKTIMRWQDATEAFDEAVGQRLDIGSAERHCLGFLHGGPKPAGAIAEAVAPTPAAVTALIDRLEARGFAQRRRSEEDRRQVNVTLTEAARKASTKYYGPITAEVAAILQAMSTGELEMIKKFFEQVLALQQRHTDRIREGKRPAKTVAASS